MFCTESPVLISANTDQMVNVTIGSDISFKNDILDHKVHQQQKFFTALLEESE